MGKRNKLEEGFFVTFEGGEGAGKSTQMKRLVAFLKQKGFAVRVTLEPGGSKIGESIRGILLDPATRNLSPRSELLLYQADRAQHVDEVIRPSLDAGMIVISDRFADSSAVYQGICRKLGLAWTEQLSRFATQNLEPDLVILLDLPAQKGMERVKKRIREDMELHGIRRRVKLDRLEREKQAFHRQVRKGFLMLAARSPKRFTVIDASLSEREVSLLIEDLLIQRLRKRGLWKQKN